MRLTEQRLHGLLNAFNFEIKFDRVVINRRPG